MEGSGQGMTKRYYIETWGCQSGTRSGRSPQGSGREDVADATSDLGGADFIDNPRSRV